ncbi:MAG: hypothetical protein JO243_22690 [Solirubrobacterales bacterium]|nr:hypothetical protein [Solirubrobacterales bacterium]MBV9338706.1 hypothetical protein [Solirubrobacterales bacterium]
MRRGDTVTNERLSDQSVALIVKRRARAAGLPPEDLSGHSLRAGYATAAAAARIEEREIANVTRCSRCAMRLRARVGIGLCHSVPVADQPAATSTSLRQLSLYE